MVSRRQGREGRRRNPQQSSEESDALIVPTCEKSAKTWVTPVESMEGRGAANGKPAPRNASPALDGQDALTANRDPHGARFRGFRQPHWTSQSPGSWGHPQGTCRKFANVMGPPGRQGHGACGGEKVITSCS